MWWATGDTLTNADGFRSIRRIRQPAVEPVSVLDAKTHLGISPDVAEHDAYLLGLIGSARIAAESRLNMTLVATQWQAVRAGWWYCSCEGAEVPYPPLLVDQDHPIEVRYKDRQGVVQFVDAEAIVADVDEFPGRLRVLQQITGGCCESVATVTWWAGVVNPSDVPSPIRTAILRMVARMFGDRGDTAEDVLTNDAAVAHLLATCSWGGRY
jgi:uncharacterized phiE125 gp8 family phage protein